MNDMTTRLKTEEELAIEEEARQADNKRVRGQINELLDLLNPEPGKYATELTIVTPSGPKAFNVSPILHAIVAQHQHMVGHTDNHFDVSLSPREQFFPDAAPEKEGEKLVKRRYLFDCEKRHVRMILTFATVFMSKDGPTTVGQPRYDVEYLNLGGPHLDNYTWRAVVNWVIGQFDRRKYVHLYSHSFEYIWDGEEKTSHLIPEKTEEEPNPLLSLNAYPPKEFPEA
jgi:hypothetical protein